LTSALAEVGWHCVRRIAQQNDPFPGEGGKPTLDYTDSVLHYT
jgi:hypothetical protein